MGNTYCRTLGGELGHSSSSAPQFRLEPGEMSLLRSHVAPAGMRAQGLIVRQAWWRITPHENQKGPPRGEKLRLREGEELGESHSVQSWD